MSARAILGLLVCGLLLPGCWEEHNPDGGGGTVVPDCRIEADGRLSADEVPAAAGLSALYVRNAPGEPAELPELVDGLRDFSDGPEDVGAWFRLEEAGEFPGAGWSAPLLVESPELRGVYRRGEAGLELLGASTGDRAEPARRIELVYEPSLLALPLPVGVGDRWGGQVQFRDATLAGLPNAGVEDWSFEAVGLESVLLPGGFSVDEVLRVEVRVERSLAIGPAAGLPPLVQTQWFAPCFGEVARWVDEGAELRRLVPR